MIGEFKNYKGYRGSIEERDGYYAGEVMGIHHVVGYEGETLDDLYEDFKDAVDDYIDCLDNDEAVK